MRIAIAGSGRLGASLMAGLERSEHQVVALVQDGRKTQGLARKVLPMAERLNELNRSPMGRARRGRLPLIWLDTMSEANLSTLKALNPDILLVGGFGIILKRPILDLPKVGCVNLHSSLLPMHRGPNPFGAVILAGERESGVTFHEMDEGIDTGAIIDQTRFPIGPRDTAADVYRKACAAAKRRVAGVMDRIAREGLRGVPQDPAAGCYDQRITEEDARMDWTRPALELDRLVRALTGMPHAWFPLQGKRIDVVKAQNDHLPCEAAPGTVVANRPAVVVATGAGHLHIHRAYTAGGLSRAWPSAWSWPKPGDVLAP